MIAPDLDAIKKRVEGARKRLLRAKTHEVHSISLSGSRMNGNIIEMATVRADDLRLVLSALSPGADR